MSQHLGQDQVLPHVGELKDGEKREVLRPRWREALGRIAAGWGGAGTSGAMSFDFMSARTPTVTP